MATEEKKMVVMTESILDATLSRVVDLQKTKQLHLPSNYSAENALRFAWFNIQALQDTAGNYVLPTVSRDSCILALLQMVMHGLNPMKHQCSFIKRGNVLTMQREYQGSIAIARRVGMKSVTAVAVFKDDIFEYSVDGKTGVKSIIKHEQTLESMAGEVKGAYAVVVMNDGAVFTEIMPMSQIRASWEMGSAGGKSKAHTKFPDQMACKTVVGRAVKTIINSSDDSDLEMIEDEPQTTEDTTAETVNTEIEDNANKTAIDFPDDTPAVNNEQIAEDPAKTDIPAVVPETQSVQKKMPF